MSTQPIARAHNNKSQPYLTSIELQLAPVDIIGGAALLEQLHRL